MKIWPIAAVLTLLCLTSQSAFSEPTVTDVVFATVDGHELKLDLYLPDGKPSGDATQASKKYPLVVFIHGGGWKNNSYKKCLTPWLTDYGFAVASIGYRLSDVAIYPAQIHDCKAGVRWLRAHADEYGYDADWIAVAGTSAGAHLALLLGVTGGNSELEGTVGDNLDQSSRVQAVVDYFGPSDFVLRSKSHPAKTEDANGSVYLLLGGKASEKLDLARLSSPAFHVTSDDAPLLIFHGTKDKTVYLEQARRIEEEYTKANLDVTFKLVEGAGHGGQEYFTPDNQKIAAEFLRSQLEQHKR